MPQVRYLIEEKTIVMLPFPQIFKLWQDARDVPVTGNLLLVSDVDFDNASQLLVPETTSKQPLTPK